VFTKEQLMWLEKIKENISTTAEIDKEDFERGKLQQMGGLGKLSGFLAVVRSLRS